MEVKTVKNASSVLQFSSHSELETGLLLFPADSPIIALVYFCLAVLKSGNSVTLFECELFALCKHNSVHSPPPPLPI